MAFAQQAAPDAPVTSASDRVQEVVVTAEKRTTNLMRTPLAATVFSGEQLQEKGVVTLDQLQFEVPSMSVSSSLQGNQFNIRGIGRGSLDVQVPSGVQIYRDNVAVFPGFFQDEPYFDLENLQVLRGPQGTFAGLNATAGAVFITERNPDFNSVNGYIRGQVGNYSDYGGQGAINIPITDTLAARFAINAESRDSFFKVYPSAGYSGNPGNLREVSPRASFLWRPNDRLDVSLKLDGSLIENGGYPSTPNPGTAFYANACPQEKASIFNICPNTKLQGQDLFGRATLNVNYRLSDGITVRSISGFQYGRTTSKIDLDGEGVDHIYYHSKADEPVASQEFDILSPNTGRFRWIFGGYYQHDTVHIPVGGFEEPGLHFFHYTTPKVNTAVFGQGTYEITDRLELQVGLRYTDYHMSLHDTLVIDGLGAFTLPASGVGKIHESDDKVTGKVALNFTMTPNQFLYGFVATGHKSGSINSTNLPFGPLNPALVKPEDITDFETGLKSTWFGGHLRTQLGLFYNRYNNFQLDLINPSSNLGYIGNASGTTIDEGVEFQAQAKWGAWSFDATAAYVSTTLGHYAALNPAAPALGVQDVTGHDLPFAPPFTYSLGGQYVFELGGRGRLTPRLDFSHTDAQWASVFDEQPPAYPFSMRLSQRNILNGEIRYDTGPWTGTLYGTNLTDQHYLSGLTNNLRYPGAPLQFGFRLERSF